MSDPAVLFYTSDFLVGTMFMTDEQTGKYIKLLCLQHQKGRLKEGVFNKIVNDDIDIIEKFKKDKNNCYYNERLENEILKRKNYSESRRSNRLKGDNDNVHIYFIRDKETKYIKIGSSVNPKRRIVELQDKNNNLELLFYTEKTSQTIESKLHKKYENKNIKLEWYDINKDLEKIINYMTIHMKLHMSYHMYKHMENENINDNINKKENKFREQLQPFSKKYSREILDEFFRYWTEPNKSGTKLRWEMEKTWDISRRLARWDSNKFNKKDEGQATYMKKELPDTYWKQ